MHAATLRALWGHFEASRSGPLAEVLCREARAGRSNVLDAFTSHPLADDWRDFAWQSLQDHFTQRQGRVYVAGNPVNPGLYKVGQTKGSVDARFKSLTTAGVVGYFVEVSSKLVTDRFEVERTAHQLLAKQAPRHKEFFQCGYDLAVQALELAALTDEALLLPLRK